MEWVCRRRCLHTCLRVLPACFLLRNVLLCRLPQAGRSWDDDSEATSFTAYVEKEMGGLMNLLKVTQLAGCALHCYRVRHFVALACCSHAPRLAPP